MIVPPRHMLSGGCIEQDTSAMKEACEMSKVPVIRRRRASSIEIPTASQNGVKSTSTKTRRKSLPALGGQVKVRAFFYWIELKSDDRFPNFQFTDSDWNLLIANSSRVSCHHFFAFSFITKTMKSSGLFPLKVVYTLISSTVPQNCTFWKSDWFPSFEELIKF